MNQNKKKLEELLLDIDLLNELNKWTTEVNFFELTGMTNYEIKHSNTLAWFFDPNENHFLNDQFIRRFLQKVISTNVEVNKDFDIFNVSLTDFSSFYVKREWKNIDILIYSNDLKMVIAIENKVYASEKKGQLNKYFKTLKEEFKDYKKMFIYLTREGIEPSDPQNWCVADYSMVIEALEETMTSQSNITDKTRSIINDYINMIRRNLGMDKELKETAQKIYSKHKKAFDLIFEVTSNNVTQFSDHIKMWLENNKEANKINYNQEYSTNTLIRFTTEFIDGMFPFDEKKMDGWRFGYSYMYEIVVRKDSVHVVGVLSNFDRENSKAFTDFVGGQKANKWKRVMTKKVLLKEEDISDGLNEDTIEKLNKSLRSLITEHIPSFEKHIEKYINDNNL